MNQISIKGARVHNLKNIDLDIPRNKLVVITGVSGSGKSSLAFDTLYAEGQRRYVESLSAYARQFLERMDKPDVDAIYGISPAIAIEQKNHVRNSRSTVGTATEIYDYLRLLFARIGKTYCYRCGKLVQRESVEAIVEKIFQMGPKTRFMIAFPLQLEGALETSKGWSDQEYAVVREGLLKKGFRRILVNDEIFSLEEETPRLTPGSEIGVVIDRMSLSEEIRERLVEALEMAYVEGQGRLIVKTVEGINAPHPEGESFKFSRNFECYPCGITYEEPEPRLFSFNNPYGACPECQGFGNKIVIDMDLVIPDKTKSIRQGAIVPWTAPICRGIISRLERIAPKYGFSIDTPLYKLTEDQMRLIIQGNDQFIGIIPFFDFLEMKKYKVHVRVFLSRFRGYRECSLCKGSRLKEKALWVKIQGATIYDITRKTILEAKTFFDQLHLTPFEEQIAHKIVEEIKNRLQYLIDVGLDYLTLDRLSRTLSGGEAQRINLATSLGSSLVSSLYVLDEPSIGLHPRDTDRLIRILKALRDKGNTIVVVEHDKDIINASDHIVDLGPGAGEYGGKVVFSGSLKQLYRDPHSLTGKYLRGEKEISFHSGQPGISRRRSPNGYYLEIQNAYLHNLKNIQVRIPLKVLTCVTGVSGSGKSTLIHEILYKGLTGERKPGNGYDGIKGQELISDVILVDQSPIGRTPRSNPVTYIKAFDEIRNLFANTLSAKRSGYKPGHFSFNVAGGRCEVCKGEGFIQVEMQFLADLFLTCESCGGKRYKNEILKIKFKGKNIADILEMTVTEALAFFADYKKIVEKLQVLEDVGLGYIRLGQPATTLSGGEAQRVKLAAHLANRKKGSALYLFDEPTTGLHLDDIAKLLLCFDKLLDKGHSVVIIEHNLEVIRCADYILDLGPEGGERGGRLIACGTPEEIAKSPESYTGKFLRPYLKAL
ncbi:MAG TPA: excinuclease ABC subunit UvrA [Candidatus Limnocylindrales bacterium]|nr:excinuclease ABC subunit UvrA [Candidatus Limnocylindrales bacterium]